MLETGRLRALHWSSKFTTRDVKLIYKPVSSPHLDTLYDV